MIPEFSLLKDFQKNFRCDNRKIDTDDEPDIPPVHKSLSDFLIDYINHAPLGSKNLGDDINDTYGIADIGGKLPALFELLNPESYAQKERKPIEDTFCSDDTMRPEKSNFKALDKKHLFSILNTSEKKTGTFQKSEPFEKKRADKRELNAFAKSIISTENFIVYEKSLYWYNNICWERLEQEDFTIIIKSYFPEDITTILGNNDYNELFKQIKTDAEIQVTIPYKKQSYYINFQNGVYDILNGCMLPHEKSYYFFNFINHKYNPTEKGGHVFERYIQSCSRGDEELQEALMQMLGYIISDLNQAKAFFILLGDRDSGKSTFGNLITAIIGEENRSALNFHNLADRWTPASLYRKKIVMDMDVSVEAINKNLIAMVNKLTGSDPIIGEQKFKNSFTFVNTCKILLAANTLPSLGQSKHEEAFLKRMVVIPIGETIPDNQKDPDLLSKLKAELNYIITQAMNALRNLINNNFQFPKIEAAEIEKEKIITACPLSRADTVKDFLQNHCIYEQNSFTTTQALYEQYQEYLIDISHPEISMSVNHFGTEVSKIIGKESQKKHLQQRGFLNIKLLDT